jgi:heme exporter protein A
VTDMPAFAVEVSKLTKSFGDHMALRGVDLKVGVGEKVALLGPNGAGKTTLVKILAAVIRPTSGRVLVGNEDLKDRPETARRRIGLVSHSTFLYGHLSIYENLDFYARMYDVPHRKSRILKVVEQVEMTDRLDDRVVSLSRGMQQRVSIARAILHDPEVMLLDEPETGLDQRASSIVKSVLLGDGRSGRAVVMITHSLERCLDLSERAVILVKGRVAHDFSTKDMRLDDLRRLYNRYTGAGG